MVVRPDERQRCAGRGERHHPAPTARDSRIGRTAAVMLGSTETTFYVLAVYFGACGVRRSRWAIPAAIAADLTGFVVAAALVRWIWGT
ncbi:MAG: hypothetical protein ACLUNO_08410 [Oscillospiraceae bacterium]